MVNGCPAGPASKEDQRVEGFVIRARFYICNRQHFLYFFPLPHGHGSLRPVLRLVNSVRRKSDGKCAFLSGAWTYCAAGVAERMTSISRGTARSRCSRAQRVEGLTQKNTDYLLGGY